MTEAVRYVLTTDYAVTRAEKELEGKHSGEVTLGMGVVRALLRGIADYKRLEKLLEDECDVTDGPDGEQRPNAAMSFLTQWRGPV